MNKDKNCHGTAPFFLLPGDKSKTRIYLSGANRTTIRQLSEAAAGKHPVGVRGTWKTAGECRFLSVTAVEGLPGDAHARHAAAAAGKKSGSVKELCNENKGVRYRASQTHGAVMISAEGEHKSTGFKVYFQKSMLAVFPPQYSLYHDRPTGIVHWTITPFHAHTAFKSQEKVRAVTIYDAQGKHTVRVDQAHD